MAEPEHAPAHSAGEPHPLDLATRLVDDGAPGLAGHTHPAYGNMVGPFGGAIAAAVFATRRDTWSSTEIGFPAPPPAADVQPWRPLEFAVWTSRYEMRFVLGGPPDFSGADRETGSISHQIVYYKE